MTLLAASHNLSFVPQPNRSELLRVESLPPLELVTSALGLFFLDDALLMAKLVRRGWDIPGGHIEPGETPEKTVRREVQEETAAELGPIQLFAAQRITVEAACPPDYPYPYPISYQLFYCGVVTRLEPFVPTDEVTARAVFTPHAAASLDWVQRHPALYQAAISLMQAQ